MLFFRMLKEDIRYKNEHQSLITSGYKLDYIDAALSVLHAKLPTVLLDLMTMDYIALRAPMILGGRLGAAYLVIRPGSNCKQLDNF